METAPASTAASTTARRSLSESDRPGITGEMNTPQGTPARFSAATASMRFHGGGAPGSVRRHTSRSSEPIDRLVRTGTRSAAAASASRSRRMSVDLVRMENGLAPSAMAPMSPRVRW